MVAKSGDVKNSANHSAGSSRNGDKASVVALKNARQSSHTKYSDRSEFSDGFRRDMTIKAMMPATSVMIAPPKTQNVAKETESNRARRERLIVIAQHLCFLFHEA